MIWMIYNLLSAYSAQLRMAQNHVQLSGYQYDSMFGIVKIGVVASIFLLYKSV